MLKLNAQLIVLNQGISRVIVNGLEILATATTLWLNVNCAS